MCLEEIEGNRDDDDGNELEGELEWEGAVAKWRVEEERRGGRPALRDLGLERDVDDLMEVVLLEVDGDDRAIPDCL